jgi:hypothetical protein
MTPNGRARSWDAQHVQAGYIFACLLLISGSAYLAIRYEEAANPRLARLEQLWPSVEAGQPLTEVIARLGTADEDLAVSTSVPDCQPADPCRTDAACPNQFVCTREYTWRAWPDTHVGASYSVCVDESGIVRRTSTGMGFLLTSR